MLNMSRDVYLVGTKSAVHCQAPAREIESMSFICLSNHVAIGLQIDCLHGCWIAVVVFELQPK